MDNDRDRELQRNQLIAIVLMTILVVVWSYFFFPQSPPAPPAAAPAPVSQEQPAAPTPAAPAAAVIDGITLPPVAEAAPAEQDEVILKREDLRLVFTKVGARLKQGEVILGDAGKDSMQLVPQWDQADAEAPYPLGLNFAGNYLAGELNRRRWEAALSPAGDAVTFTIELAGVARVTKTFRLAEAPNVVEAEVGYTNLGTDSRILGVDAKEPAFSLVWAPNVTSGDASTLVQQEVVWRQAGVMTHHATNDLEPPEGDSPFTDSIANPEYVAIKSAYFAVALKPEFEGSEGWVAGSVSPSFFSTGVGASRMEVKPGEQVTRAYKLYLGPTQLAALKNAWPGLDSLLQFFTMFQFMDVFAKMLLSVLHWFYTNVYANYGAAIIFLTVLVRLAVFPLTLKSMRSMKKMQKLAPELEEIKKEIGDDQQELQRRMMALYRERGVNPLGGCLPIFLQMPVFIALYRMYSSAFELRRAPFVLWINDLSEPDRLFQLPFAIPLPFTQSVINSFNLLPILMGLSMIVSTKLMPTSGPVQNQQQKIIMNVVPVVFSLACYNTASGLTLYILVSTVLGIAQNYFVHVSDSDVKKKVKPARPVGKSRNFYTAALAKKRQALREEKRDKRARANRPDAKPKEPSRKK